MNRSVRLPEFAPATASRHHAGEDLSVLCNVSAEQRTSVCSTTGADGRPLITVTVGAVTIDVHTTSALRTYLAAWRKAATVTGLLEATRDNTTNRGIASWGNVLGDEMLAAAMLDRLLDRSVVMHLDGDSYRLRSHTPAPTRSAKSLNHYLQPRTG